MKIVCLLTSDSISAECERNFRPLREAGIEPVVVRSQNEFELCMRDPEFGASLHPVGANNFSPAEYVECVRRFPDKLAIVSGTVKGVARGFASVLRQSEAELLILLDETENVAAQIRRRMPLWLTRRWVNDVLLPELESGLDSWSSEHRELLYRHLQECSVVHARKGPNALSEPEMKRLNTRLKRSGFVTAAEIGGAIQLYLCHVAMSCVGWSPKESVKICQLSDERLVDERARKVFGTADSRKRRNRSMEEMSAGIIAYICGTQAIPQRSVPAPSIAQSLSSWLQATGRTDGQLGLDIGKGMAAVAHVIIICALMDKLDGFLSAYLIRKLRHREQAEDAKARAWWLAWCRILRGEVGGIPLTAEAVRTHRAQWKKLLVSICRSEVATTFREVNRRANLLDAVLQYGMEGTRRNLDTTRADEELELAERDVVIHAAILTLSAEQQSMIELAFYQEMSVREIHRRTGIPLEAVRGLIEEGLANLREALNDVWGDLQG